MRVRSGGFFDDGDGDGGPPGRSFWPVVLLIAGTVGMLALIAWVFPFSYGQ